MLFSENRLQVVVHELLHTAGVRHEQCRPDRDEYITIDWSNMAEGGPSQFYKVEKIIEEPLRLT